MSAAIHPLLSRRPHRSSPALDLGAGASLALPRLHEACGEARRSFAMLVAARLGAAGRTGPIWWIGPEWQTECLLADGVAGFAGAGPERMIFAHPKREEDVLWTLEEVLRSGSAALAVADLPGMPGLTAVRRLHLAAETGATEGRSAPLGLLLTPGDGGAQGVESRWLMQSAHHSGNRTRWRLERLRARMEPPRKWLVHRHKGACILAAPEPPAPPKTASEVASGLA
jgi:protein ImuA